MSYLPYSFSLAYSGAQHILWYVFSLSCDSMLPVSLVFSNAYLSFVNLVVDWQKKL